MTALGPWNKAKNALIDKFLRFAFQPSPAAVLLLTITAVPCSFVSYVTTVPLFPSILRPQSNQLSPGSLLAPFV